MEFRSLALLVFAAFALAIIIVAFTSADLSNLGSFGASDSCVGVMHLSGTISSSSGSPFSRGSVTPDAVSSSLDSAESDSSIASVLMIINSPGGSAAASKEMFDRIRDSKKPVVAYLQDEAASGGYYAASATNYIVANPDTLTGSIGARADLLSYEELLNKLGVRQESLKTGALKDIGAPYRNATPQERALLHAILNETFDNFKHDVQAGRGNRLSSTGFAGVLDGRVLSATQAQRIGLVDQVGTQKVALLKAAELGNLTVAKGSLPKQCSLDASPSLLDFFSSLSASFAQGLSSPLQQTSASVNFHS